MFANGKKSAVPAAPPVLSGFETIRRHFDEKLNMWTATVQPGEFYVSYNDEVLSTVLGSCVSVCMRDSRLRIGGMNHFLLPGDDGQMFGDFKRYGTYALEVLINELIKYGGSRERFETKLFGGAKVTESSIDIGATNVEFIRKYFANERMPVHAESLGGTAARHVRFHPVSGRVTVVEVPMSEGLGAEKEARQRAENLRRQAEAPGKVLLF